MPEMTIEIGGRSFTVACQEGEEGYLTSAAEMLNREAQTLLSAGSRLSQDRMLLMAGLMLADKAISAEEELRTMDRRVAEQASVIDEMQTASDGRPTKPVIEIREVEKIVEKDVVPQSALDRIDALAAKAEALAAPPDGD